MNAGKRIIPLLWFAGLYLAGLVAMASVAFVLRAGLKLLQG